MDEESQILSGAHLVALQNYGENVSMLTALLSFMIVTELSVLNLPMIPLKPCSYVSIYLMIVLKILMIICSILVSCCNLEKITPLHTYTFVVILMLMFCHILDLVMNYGVCVLILYYVYLTRYFYHLILLLLLALVMIQCRGWTMFYLLLQGIPFLLIFL